MPRRIAWAIVWVLMGVVPLAARAEPYPSRPDFAEQRLEARALTPKVIPVDALRAFMVAERERWGGLVRATGAKVN